MGKITPYHMHVHHIQYHLYNLHAAIYGKHTGPSQYPHCHLGNLENKRNIYVSSASAVVTLEEEAVATTYTLGNFSLVD